MNLGELLARHFTDESGYAWLNGILDALNNVLFPILLVVAAVGTIYAIYLGVMLAKAENAEKREEAKKRIINAVIALAIVVVLALLMKVFVEFAPDMIGVDESMLEPEKIALL